jgi:hypothetical protein
MIACECSREFHLIASVLPLLGHNILVSSEIVSVSKETRVMRLPLTLSSPQERLIGERVVVKEIEIFGDFWSQKIEEDIQQ